MAVGQCQGTSNFAFRSNRYLQNVDKTPPQVSALTNNYDKVFDVDERKDANNYAYSGTVYITFSEPLYYRENAEERSKIIDMQFSDEPGYKSSFSLLGGSSGSGSNSSFTLVPQVPSGTPLDSAPACEYLEFNYGPCRPGTTLTFSRNLCDATGNVGTQALSFKLILVEEDGLLIPTFEFSSNSVANIWDGRGGKK